ncbi:hypothetical protein ACKLNR_005896 [Fusarium oxysporum f. sp. zingiberi]
MVVDPFLFEGTVVFQRLRLHSTKDTAKFRNPFCRNDLCDTSKQNKQTWRYARTKEPTAQGVLFRNETRQLNSLCIPTITPPPPTSAHRIT